MLARAIVLACALIISNTATASTTYGNGVPRQGASLPVAAAPCAGHASIIGGSSDCKMPLMRCAAAFSRAVIANICAFFQHTSPASFPGCVSADLMRAINTHQVTRYPGDVVLYVTQYIPPAAWQNLTAEARDLFDVPLYDADGHHYVMLKGAETFGKSPLPGLDECEIKCDVCEITAAGDCGQMILLRKEAFANCGIRIAEELMWEIRRIVPGAVVDVLFVPDLDLENDADGNPQGTSTVFSMNGILLSRNFEDASGPAGQAVLRARDCPVSYPTDALSRDVYSCNMAAFLSNVNSGIGNPGLYYTFVGQTVVGQPKFCSPMLIVALKHGISPLHLQMAHYNPGRGPTISSAGYLQIRPQHDEMSNTLEKAGYDQRMADAAGGGLKDSKGGYIDYMKKFKP